jgi:hypothetical protein
MSLRSLSIVVSSPEVHFIHECVSSLGSPYSVIDEFYVLQSMVQRVESLYLEEGHWFLSIYNDDGDSQAVEITISASAQLTGKTNVLKLFSDSELET